jgi:hypothetical protein
MANPLPPPPQWVLDLNSPPVAKKTTGISDPPGFTATAVGGKVSSPRFILRFAN